MKRTTRGRTAANRNWTSKNTFRSFPPLSSLLTSSSLDRVGDLSPDDTPTTKGKTPKHKADKKAAKVLHERVVVRLNPPSSGPCFDFYASFYSSITRPRATGSDDELSIDGRTMDLRTPGPSTNTCKVTTFDRLTHLHVRPQRTLKTHPSHNQEDVGSPSEVSSNLTKRSLLPHPHLSSHTTMAP